MAGLLDLVFLTSEGPLMPAYWLAARFGSPAIHQLVEASVRNILLEETKAVRAKHLQLQVTGKLCA